MPRKAAKVPAYCLHKASGRAVVRVNGKDHYLGPFGSAESHERYAELIERWRLAKAAPKELPELPPSQELSVNELLLKYWDYAESYYSSQGQPTKELVCMRDALRPVKRLYGNTLVRDFGPKSLKTVREFMITEQQLARSVVNQRIGRIKRVFKWGVAEELISPSILHGLQAVEGLRRGRTPARETDPVEPVADNEVRAVLPFVAPHVAAMIQLQRLTGMRPGEVVLMRPCDLDRSRQVWIYEPESHKGRWRGARRLVPIGPRAQELIGPYLERDAADYLFSPREAEAWRRQHRPAYQGRTRSTPLYPSELRRRELVREQRKGRVSKRPKRPRYDTDSYRRAIEYGFRKARQSGVAISNWHPNQLRHTRGTEIRKTHGIEAAQVILGHARADVTQVYAQRDLEAAIAVAWTSG